MIIDSLNSEVLTMCAVCISDTSGGQNALLIIVLSFILLGLLNSSWKKYFKKEKYDILENKITDIKSYILGKLP